MIDAGILKSEAGQETVLASLKKRQAEPSLLEIVSSAAKERSSLTTKLEELQAERNSGSKQLGILKGEGKEDEFNAMRARMKEISDEVTRLKEQQTRADEKFSDLLANIPNLLDERVPEGMDENDNREIRSHGTIPDFPFPVAPHYEILEECNLVDFERGASLAGARFYVYNEEIALLERKLINLMLDIQRAKGYRERAVPLLVRDNAMFGTGQYPKFADEYYRLEKDGLNLIPTSEVPLTNLYADQILTEEELPLGLTAQTACFRREAGSAGRDTRGLVRVHQFMKVEIVKFCLPENSENELESMVHEAAEILRLLQIPHRVMLLCSGDTSFASSMTYDIEVWMPGLQRWLEISSVSNFRDFQARRAKIRVKRKATGKNEYLHTLNGSAVAAGRLVAALLEYHQTPERTIDFGEIDRKITQARDSIG